MNLAETLLDDGLIDLPAERWLRSPRESSPSQLIAMYDSRLDAAHASGHVEGLEILDSQSSVMYYRGRWRAPRNTDQGRFVTRRPQAFGADLWCYVELNAGMPIRLLDLPLNPDLGRGCDEAWRLQAAIDAFSGQPQRMRLTESGAPERSVLQLFSPPPRWLQRRLDAIGQPVESRRALLSYEMSQMEASEEFKFAKRMLWLEETTG